MKFSILSLIIISLSFFVLVFADDAIKQVQHADVAEITMKKYQINVNGTNYTVFYRLSTTVESAEGTPDDFEAKVISMQINNDRKSMIITLDNVKQTDIMSVRFEKSLVSSEGKRLLLMIDSKEKGYESSSQDDKRSMIFLVPANTTQVEIIGTRVIPEFPSELLVLIIVSSGVVLIQKLKN